MFIGLIFENEQYVESVRVNANDELTAQKKLDAFIAHKNDTHEGLHHTGFLVDGAKLKTITRLRY